MAKYTKAEQTESLERLRELCPRGARIYTTCTHVARSGMSRRLRVFVMRGNVPMSITWDVARACGWSVRDKGNRELVVGGCGMDMGFHVVYTLARVLFPDGHRCSGHDCPSNDHSNGMARPAPLGTVHRDGGYALRQVWL